MKKPVLQNEHLALRVQKSQARFTRIKNPKGADTGEGHFFMLLEVVAESADVYVPLSIASSKKTTGFMYYIDGTAQGSIGTAQVDARGLGVSKITLGTLQFVKIPKGRFAEFRVQVDIEGKIGKAYTVRIHQLNYKLAPTDARYKKFTHEIPTKTLSFK